MLKIGEFAELSSISIHMLRNYDKIGLLVPSHVDEINGYRYYDRSQLMQANEIISLKSMGFGLDEIKEYLYEQQAPLKKVLSEKLNEKYQELGRLQQQITQIKSILHTETNLDDYALSIVRKTLAPMQVVCLKGEIECNEQEGILWQQLSSECEKNKLSIPSDALAMSIYHGFDEQSRNAVVELQLLMENRKKVKAPLFLQNYPERNVVSAIFKGNYSQIGLINSAIAEWLEVNGLEIAGQSFTIYHNSPENCPEVSEFITELCFPVKEAT